MRTIGLLALMLCTAGCASKQGPTTVAPTDDVWEDHAASVPADTVSVTGTDRASWAPLTVSSVDSRVPHFPYYMKQPWVLHPHRPSPLYRQDKANELAMAAALHDDPGKLSREVVQMSLSPIGFGVELVALPLKALTTDQPWDIRHSPE